MMNEATGGVDSATTGTSGGGVHAEIGAIGRMVELARAQRAAVARDDLEGLDSAGQEIDALLRECSRLRRTREAAGASLEGDDSERLRSTAQQFVDELAINRRVFREAIAGINERAANLYRPSSALYARPEASRVGGIAP